MNKRKWLLRKTVALTVILGFGIILPGRAAENQETLTLQQIVDSAMKNHPTVIESQNRWEEKEGRKSLAITQPNPKFGIMKDDMENGPFSLGSAMMTEYSLSQEIMNPAKLRAMGKMAGSDALMAKANYQDQQLAAYVAAKTAYYDLLYAGKALAIGQENQQLMGQLVQIAQVNYATGMVSLQDALRAQTEFSRMTTDLLSMAAMEAVAKAKLNTAMGRAADTVIGVKEEFTAPPPDFNLTTLIKTASESNPAVIGMQRQVEMAQGGVELAKKQQLPDYELQLSYKDRKPTGMESQPSTWKVGFMVMLPLWQAKNKAEITTANANLAAAQASLTNMQNMTALDIQMALTEAQAAWRKIDLYQNTIVPAAEQTYQAGVVGYTNGKVDFMAVLDSLTALRNAKLDYYKVRIDYEKAATNLEKAVGKPLFISGANP